jgi:hypothetical protein
MIRKLDEENPLLYLQNIPALMMKNNFSRYEVHNIYTLYKVLLDFYVGLVNYHFAEIQALQHEGWPRFRDV